MGERALAAVRCGQGYDIYAAHSAGSDRLLRQVLGAPADEQLATLCAVDWTDRGTRATLDSLDWLDTLGIEAVFFVSARGVTTAHPVWLGFSSPEASAGTTRDALVRIERVAERRRLRTVVQSLKGRFHEGIRRGALTESEAGTLLALALTGYCPPGRVHLGDISGMVKV